MHGVYICQTQSRALVRVKKEVIYVYGGHVGDAHVYSKETHSKSFVRLNLKSEKKTWEKLPFNDSLQGFGMAPVKVGSIYLEALRQQMKMGRNRISVR